MGTRQAKAARQAKVAISPPKAYNVRPTDLHAAPNSRGVSKDPEPFGKDK